METLNVKDFLPVKTGMIKDSRTLILFRENLCFAYKDENINDMSYWQFKFSDDPTNNRPKREFETADLCLFIDKNGDTKILKSRWGNIGILK